MRSGEQPMRVTTKFRAAVITIALTVLLPLHAACAQDVVVFAAVSLTNALNEAAQLFERQGSALTKISHAASSARAKQIENGTPAENVRAALAFVSRREAPLGIVYATDAAADPRVKVIAVFPEDTHPPIV